MTVSVLVSLALVLAACGTSGGGGDGDGGGGGGGGSTSSISTPEQMQEALEAAGAECTEPGPIPEEDAGGFMGAEPTVQVECELDGREVGALFFERETDRIAAVTVIQSLACGFAGQGFAHLASGAWLIGVDDEGSEGDEAMSPEARAVLDQVAEELDVEVQGEECPEGSGSGFGEMEEGEEEPTRTGPGSSKDDPLAIGESATIGDYEVTLIEVDVDANDEVAAAAEFNEPPEKGRYVLFTYEATYVGEDEGTPSFDLTGVLSGGDSVQYSSNDCFQTLGDSSSLGVTVENGGTARVTDCIDTTPEAIDGGALFIEAFVSFDEDRVYWALP